MDSDRRQHRRLSIPLSVECFAVEGIKDHVLRCMTTDISTGGLRFEAELPQGSLEPVVNSLMTVELTIPPGDGHFPYEGRVRSVAEILRCEVLEARAAGEESAATRHVGVAARFREPLKLAF